MGSAAGTVECLPTREAVQVDAAVLRDLRGDNHLPVHQAALWLVTRALHLHLPHGVPERPDARRGAADWVIIDYIIIRRRAAKAV